MPLTDSLRDDILASVPSLRAFAISLSGNGDRADDLVQETLLRALANIDSFQPGSNLPAWLFTILRNLFRSDYRKRRREVEDADGSYATTLKTQPAQNAHLEFEEFRAALDKLPQDQREALILVGASGFSYEDAAAICGCGAWYRFAWPIVPDKPRTLADARERKNMLAGQKVEQDGGAKIRGNVSFDVKATSFGAYDAAFIAAMQHRWYDLLDSSQFTQQSGKVVLEFRLMYDGRITDMKVNGNDVGELLGLLCQRAVLDPAPFAQWPSDMRRKIGQNYREVTFTFYYN